MAPTGLSLFWCPQHQGAPLPLREAGKGLTLPAQWHGGRQHQDRWRSTPQAAAVEQQTVRPDVHPSLAAAPDQLRQSPQPVNLRDPEDLTIAPGELTNVSGVSAQQTPFRCLGCLKPECQVLSAHRLLLRVCRRYDIYTTVATAGALRLCANGLEAGARRVPGKDTNCHRL